MRASAHDMRRYRSEVRGRKRERRGRVREVLKDGVRTRKHVGLLSERREGTKRMLSVRAEGLVELHDFLGDVLAVWSTTGRMHGTAAVAVSAHGRRRLSRPRRRPGRST